MSSTTRRPHAAALAGAEAFKALFPPETYEAWTFAGSLRRNAPDVADVEHVCIPKFGDAPSADLFATPVRVNLLFAHADKLVAAGNLTKHLYANGYRWGDLYRGIDFAYGVGIVMNEMFCATWENWGSRLAICTGPADFSRRLVTGLLRNGRRNHEGYVWACDPCAEPGCRGAGCPKCDGKGLVPRERLSVPTEEMYFDLCGFRYIVPEARA